jgi:hypothetical protein
MARILPFHGTTVQSSAIMTVLGNCVMRNRVLFRVILCNQVVAVWAAQLPGSPHGQYCAVTRRPLQIH